MKKIKIACITGLLFIWANSLLGQVEGLSEKFKRDLVPQSARETGAVADKTKGVGGKHNPPTHRVDGRTQPSTTIELHFEFDSALLTPDAVKVVNELGKALQGPELKGYVFNLESHTDTVGSDDANLELSRRRAQAVVDHMVNSFDLDHEQFRVKPFGESRPVSTVSQSLNRRVVIVNTEEPFQAAISDKPRILVHVKRSTAHGEMEVHQDGRLTQKDSYAIELTPKTSAHVHVYQIDSRGSVTKLFPNPEYSRSPAFLEPGRLCRIPDYGNWLFLDENTGKEHIIVIAQYGELKEEICQRILDDTLHRTRPSHPTEPPQGERGAPKPKGVAGARPGQTIPPFDMDKVFKWELSFIHD